MKFLFCIFISLTAIFMTGCNGKANRSTDTDLDMNKPSQVDSTSTNNRDSVENSIIALHKTVIDNWLSDNTQAPTCRSNDKISDFLIPEYGMDKNTRFQYTFYDPVLNHIPPLICKNFIDTIFQIHDDDRYKFQISLSIYIDRNFPNQKVQCAIEKALDQTICNGLYNDNVADFEVKDVTAQKVYPSATVDDFIRFWGQQFSEITTANKEIGPSSEYAKIPDIRVCVAAHKIYEDTTWVTYMVHNSLDFHGSCGCSSATDYLSLNKSDGNILNIQEAINRYDKNLIEEMVYTQYLNSAFMNNSTKTFEPAKSYIIDRADGVAVIPSGLLFYFKPYTIGSGAEGQYNLIINPD